MPIDYETLRLVWWALIGILLIGFALTDGFDLGVAIWLPWLAKDDQERRVLITSIAPVWEGNQVWFILAGGAIFAAWPPLYAIAFSGFYYAMLLVLLALILRAVGLKYRSKSLNPAWRSTWDRLIFVSGFVPALLFGVAMGNVLQGVPFHFDANLRAFYTGHFLDLLNPFSLLAGMLSLAMLAMHGACFLNLKTTAPIQPRARTAARITAILSLVLFISGGLWLYYGPIMGYGLNQLLPHSGPSNPLYKSVMFMPRSWFTNYTLYPLTQLIPALGLFGLLGVALFPKLPRLSFCLSSVSLTSIISTVGVSLFPFILPSSSTPSHSLLVWDSSSSQLTLFIMLISTCIFLPIILAYSSWVYYVFRGKVTPQDIHQDERSAY